MSCTLREALMSSQRAAGSLSKARGKWGAELHLVAGMQPPIEIRSWAGSWGKWNIVSLLGSGSVCARHLSAGFPHVMLPKAAPTPLRRCRLRPADLVALQEFLLVARSSHHPVTKPSSGLRWERQTLPPTKPKPLVTAECPSGPTVLIGFLDLLWGAREGLRADPPVSDLVLEVLIYGSAEPYAFPSSIILNLHQRFIFFSEEPLRGVAYLNNTSGWLLSKLGNWEVEMSLLSFTSIQKHFRDHFFLLRCFGCMFTGKGTVHNRHFSI